MKFLKGFAILLLLLIIVYFLGPKPSTPRYNADLPVIPAHPAALENYVAAHEAHPGSAEQKPPARHPHQENYQAAPFA